MPMKILLILMTWFVYQSGWGQDSCIQKHYASLTRIIQKNIPYTDAGGDYTEKVAEFFIIEIRLNDKEDSILTIHYYSKGDAKNKKQIQGAIKKIKDNWKPSPCGVNRIIAPVFIHFQNDNEKFENYPFDLMMDKITSNEPGKKTYTGNIINIFVFGAMQ
jgi:hypothetical protein